MFRFLLVLLFASGLKAQTEFPYGFRYNSNIPVTPFGSSVPYANAWTGGLNAPQFSQIDLDDDGSLELIVFDRTGNKLLTFKRVGADWKYMPQFERCLPALFEWVLFRDFDKDGKQDIFTSSGNGITVYRNTGFSAGCPGFEIASPLLYSVYTSVPLNLFVSRVDFPTIEDIDGDGDLDILTFFILGTCLEYHKNLSQELYGNNDHLEFKRESDNWGKFTEDPLSNAVSLNDSCDRSGQFRHTGSTLLAHDLDHDNDFDLLIGDVSYAEVLSLINQPTNEVDQIIPFPANYPENFNNYSTEIFPASFRIFADGDTLPDLVVAANTDLQSVNSARGVKLYRTVNSGFDFTGTEEYFLSDEMIDGGRGAYPVLADMDNDGDYDLLLGNSGEFEPSGTPLVDGNYRASLKLYENTGNNSNPVFIEINDDLAELKALNLKHIAPATADLDGDNRPDLIFGMLNGTLRFFRNGDGLQFTEITGVVDGIDVADNATPFLFDFNNDGKQDIICGNKQGHFYIFLNSGTLAAPAFNAVADYPQLGGADTIEETESNFGYSAPAIYRQQDTTWLLSGSERGTLMAWKLNISDLNAPLTIHDSSIAFIDPGEFSSIIIKDLDNDGFPEMINGNRRGGITFYKGQLPTNLDELIYSDALEIYPNPAFDHFRIRGWNKNKRGDVLIADLSGRIVFKKSFTNEPDAIDIHALSQGIYFIRIENKNGVVKMARLVKL